MAGWNWNLFGRTAAAAPNAGIAPNALKIAPPLPPGQQPAAMTIRNPAQAAAPTKTPWVGSDGFFRTMGHVARFGAAIAPQNPVAQGLGGLGAGLAQQHEQDVMQAASDNLYQSQVARPGGTQPASLGSTATPGNLSIQNPTQAPGSALSIAAPSAGAAGPAAPPDHHDRVFKVMQSYLKMTQPLFSNGPASAPAAAPDFRGASPQAQETVLRAIMLREAQAAQERQNAGNAALDLYKGDRPSYDIDPASGAAYKIDPASGTVTMLREGTRYFDQSHGSRITGINTATGQETSRIEGPAREPAAPHYQYKVDKNGNLVGVSETDPTDVNKVPGVEMNPPGEGRAGVAEHYLNAQQRRAKELAQRDPAVRERIAAAAKKVLSSTTDKKGKVVEMTAADAVDDILRDSEIRLSIHERNELILQQGDPDFYDGAYSQARDQFERAGLEGGVPPPGRPAAPTPNPVPTPPPAIESGKGGRELPVATQANRFRWREGVVYQTPQGPLKYLGNDKWAKP